MQHFFVEPTQIQGREIRITGEDVNHIRNVLRMRVSEELSVSNGVDGKEYRCEIAEIRADEVLCHLRFIKEDGVELPVRITLFQGLPKADKMELIIQKAVELGASEIIPVATARSVVKLDAKKAKAKVERWQAIAEAAAKQSRRAFMPQIREVMTMQSAAAYAGGMDLSVIPYELAEGMDTTRSFFERSVKLAQEFSQKQIREDTKADINREIPETSIKADERKRIGIFIGPEGGFTEEEIDMAGKAGIEPISLGRRILRTETAGMALISALMLKLETEV